MHLRAASKGRNSTALASPTLGVLISALGRVAKLRLGFGVLGQKGAELGDDLGLLVGKVHAFLRIGMVVVQFQQSGVGGGAGFLPFDQPMARGANGAAYPLAAGGLVRAPALAGRCRVD